MPPQPERLTQTKSDQIALYSRPHCHHRPYGAQYRARQNAMQLTVGGMVGCPGAAESAVSLASEARASVRLLERGGRGLTSPPPCPPSMSSSGVLLANTSSFGSWPGCSRLCSGTGCSAGAPADAAGSPGVAAAAEGRAGACCAGGCTQHRCRCDLPLTPATRAAGTLKRDIH